MKGDSTEQLIFPIGLTVDQKVFEKTWAAQEKVIQKLIDKSDFKIKVQVDSKALTSTLAILERIQNAQNSFMTKSSAATMASKMAVANQKAESIAKESNARITRQNEAAEAKLAAQKTRTALATQKLTRETDRQTNSFKSQRGVLNGIPQLLSSYVSVLGGFRFVKNIQEVTAEFELQRVALAAIIQNKPKADSLFSEIVELGIQSPFQIKELISYTKQLAAFRVETDQLFDTTSRLADVSAGLGVDMSRLILAYGQVRAASVLRGQELRQFTEAGIPLVDLLAKKFTALNGVVTTTGDVFELISKRQVPFAMIDEIFKEMTEAGGVFYNMQRIQAETLKGIWSNLRDAYDKMFMSMGEANMGLFKGIGNTLRMFAENWETIVSLVGRGVAAYTIYRAALFMTNAMLGKQTKSLLSNIMASKANEAQRLREAGAYRTLTGVEGALIRTSTKLNSVDMTSLMANKRFTKDIALRMIATKKLTLENQKQLIQMGFLTQAEVAKARSTNRVKLALITASASARAFGVSMKAVAVAMLANPYTWVIAGLSAIISIFSKARERSKEFREQIKSMSQEMGIYANELTEAYKAIDEIIYSGMTPGADDASIKKAVDALTEIIIKNEALAPIVAERLKGVEQEAEKLKILLKLYEDIEKISQGGGIDPSAIPNAIKSSGSWINKDIVETTNNLSKRIESVSNELAKMSRYGVIGVTAVQKKFDEATKAFKKGEISLDDYQKKLDNIPKSSNFNPQVWVTLQRRIGDVGEGLEKTKKRSKEFFDDFKARVYEINGQRIDWDADKWGLTEENFKALQANLNIAKEMWFRTADEIQRGVISGLWGGEFKIPFLPTPSGTGKQLGQFAKAYNSFITKSKFTQIPLIGEKETDLTELKIIERVSDVLKDKEELLARVNAQIAEGNKINADTLPALQKEVSEYKKLAAWVGVVEKAKTGEKDPRIDSLEREVDIITTAYKKYEEYIKFMSSDKAQAAISERYGSEVSTLKLGFSSEGIEEQLGVALKLFKSFGPKAASAYWDTWDKQADTALTAVSKTVKKRLDGLSKEISSMQKSNEFFEKMLGMTDDRDLSKKIALQVTGFEVGDIREKLIEQLKTVLSEFNVTLPEGKIDIAKLRMTLGGLDIGKDQLAVIDEFINAYVENEARSVEKLFSNLDKYQTYEDKRAAIIRQGQEMINLAIVTGQTQQMANAHKMTEQKLAELEYENFKTTESYLDMFGDLDKVSTVALKNIRDKVVELSKTIGSKLSPTNMKEIVSKINDLDKEIVLRNPFQAWAESQKEIARIESMISYFEGMLDLDGALQLNPAVVQSTILIIENLKKQLAAVTGVSMDAKKGIVKNFGKVQDSAKDVVSAVRDIFEEFQVGEEDIASHALKLIETLGSGVMNVLTTTAQVSVQGISSVEKASVILTIIATVLKIAMIIYNMFSKDAQTRKEIEALTKDVEYLEEMYGRLNDLKDSDPLQLKRLKDELIARKAILATTKAQVGAASTKKHVKLLEEINKRLRIAGGMYSSLSVVMNDVARGAQARVASLKLQNNILKEILRKELSRGRKMDLEKVLELQEQIAKNETDIAYSFLDALSDAAGNVYMDLSDSIADALKSAWENGEDGARAFQRTVHEVMRNVVIDLWKANVLSGLITPVMEEVYQALGLDKDGKVKDGKAPDFVIDPREAKAIEKAITTSEKGVTDSWKAIEQVLKMFNGGGSSDLTGLSKAIGTMSEETALTLGGYANSMLFYIVAQYNIQMKMLDVLENPVAMVPTNIGDSANVMTNLYQLQSQTLHYLQQIAKGVDSTADSAARILDAINKMSIKGGKVMNVTLIN